MQVKCQREALAAIYSGWVPCTPLNRGLQSLPEQPALLLSSPALSCDDCCDTEPESECDEVEGSQSDSGSDDSDEDSDSLTAFDGPWMRNIATGWYHKAIRVTTDMSWRPACRAIGNSGTRFELHETNPCFQGWTPCAHSACRSVCG